MLPEGWLLHPALLRHRLRRGLARQVTDLTALRTDPVSPGGLPDGGTVAVTGEVRPYEPAGVPRAAGSRTPSVLYRLRVDAYPEPVEDPERRSFADGSVVTDDVHAVPFVLADGEGRERETAVVDPVPRAAEEGLTPERTVRPRTDYVSADVRFPHEGLVTAGRLRELDERRRSWLRETSDLSASAFVRVLERRLSPGDRVTVLGHRVLPGPDTERDVIHVRSWRSPFRIAPVEG